MHYNGNNDNDNPVSEVGKDVIDKYNCTKLEWQEKSSSGNSKINSWMSKEVPGYQQLVKTLMKFGMANLDMTITGNVFNWGGLVKLYREDTDDNGSKTTMEVHLVEANPSMSFPESDFEVPKK